MMVNSRALEFHDAHGEFHGWPQSYALYLIKQLKQIVLDVTQEGGSLAGAEHFEDGKIVVFRKACWGCHAIDILLPSKLLS